MATNEIRKTSSAAIDTSRVIPQPHLIPQSDVKDCYRLRDLARYDNVELEELVKVIRSNRLLTNVFIELANTLQNSLRYSRRGSLSHPIDSVNRALLTLGTSRVLSIAEDLVKSFETVNEAVNDTRRSAV